MGKVNLSMGLLDLIVMVQTYKKLIIRESLFNKAHGLEGKDWHEETERYFNNIDNSILQQYGLVKNIVSYEKVINYKVTSEMLKTEADKLSRFQF